MKETQRRQDDAMTTPTKKMIPVLILDILRRHSDSEHTLTQTDIARHLKTEYDLDVERKAVRRNIDNLLALDNCPIQYTETARKRAKKSDEDDDDSSVISELWYVHEFSESELRLLIDSLLFSNHIPHKRCQELVKKLEGLTSEYFKAHVKHVATLPDAGITNPELFLNIEILDQAIEMKRKVCFNYLLEL